GRAATPTAEEIRKALKSDLKALHKEIEGVRADAGKVAAPAGGGPSIETLQGVLTEQLGAVYSRLKAVEESGAGVPESRLFADFMNSEELKDLLDEKFKGLRTWLTEEEIPRQIQKLADR
ncbi:MAG: hypothetical protein ACYTFG_18120, partial [Planctomycetota bacterium]